jgi:hydroxyacylglutathione hydrolase
MLLTIERIPTLRDNYSYLLVCEATREAAIVDAPESAPVLARVAAANARVVAILSTHHHPDHSAANPELAKRFGAPVYGHHSDADRIPGFTTGLERGDRVKVGQSEAEVLFIPAHTRAHIAYHFAADRALFCGDTLFAAGCGRLFEGTPQMMFDAMRVLAALPDDTRVFCGHEYTQSNLKFAAHADPGNRAVAAKQARVAEVRARAAADWHDATPAEMTVPSTLAEERETNVFLRAATAADLGRLRALKDAF